MYNSKKVHNTNFLFKTIKREGERAVYSGATELCFFEKCNLLPMDTSSSSKISRGNMGPREQKYKSMMKFCCCNILGLLLFVCTNNGNSFKDFRNFY